MMPFTGGVDRQLQMEMMKGPQQLQREIQTLGPDTIKLIALQRFVDQEKANAMQANLQAQPPMVTVADQLRQEATGIASMQRGNPPALQDVAQRVAGVNQQKMAQEQQNMRRAAQGPAKPVMAYGGGLMSRPVNNIGDRYFQGGGIVAFQTGTPGKEITEEQIKNAMSKFGISREDAIARLLKRPATPGERARAMQSAQREAAIQAGDMDGAGVLKTPEQEMEDVTGDMDIASLLTKDTTEEPQLLASAGPPTAGVPTGTPTTTPAGTVATPTGIAATLAPAPTSSGMEELTKRLGDRAGLSPTEAATKRREEAEKAIGYTAEEKEGLAALQQERKTLEESALDPVRAQYRALREAFASGAGTTNLGTLGARVSESVSASQDRERDLRKELFGERADEAKELMEKSRAIRAEAYGEGQKEAELTRGEIDSALQGLVSIARDENRAAVETSLANASNQTRVDIANMETEIRREGNRLQSEANNLAREDRTMVGIATQITNLLGTQERIRADIAAKYSMELQMAQQTYLNAKTDKEQEKAKAKYDAVDKTMRDEIAGAIKDVKDQLDQYQDMLTKGISVI